MGITIYDYFYNNIKGIKKFSSYFPNIEEAKTPKDFYDSFINKTLLDKESAIGWHKLLIKYINESDDCIHFCRLYESGGQKDSNNIQIDRIRRTAETDDNGFKYIFVSNYDAAEMFNIIKQGVEPDFELFKKMVLNHTYKFHYQKSSPIPNLDDYLDYLKTQKLPEGFKNKSIQEEYYILSGYPNVGSVKGSVLNKANRYLAHIIGVKDTPFYFNDKKIVSGSRLTEILPRGDINDWKKENGRYIRKLNSNLSDDDKRIIKAHFLRFFDPLNYFATPSKHFHKHEGNLSNNKNIGEYWALQKYVEEQYEEIYGKEVMDEFRKYALVPPLEDLKFNKFIPRSNELINVSSIKYGLEIKKELKKIIVDESAKPLKDKPKQRKNKPQKYSDETKVLLIKHFLNNDDSYSYLDKEILKCETDRHGSTSFNILKQCGFTTQDRNILKIKAIDELISTSSGIRFELLMSIK